MFDLMMARWKVRRSAKSFRFILSRPWCLSQSFSKPISYFTESVKTLSCWWCDRGKSQGIKSKSISFILWRPLPFNSELFQSDLKRYILWLTSSKTTSSTVSGHDGYQWLEYVPPQPVSQLAQVLLYVNAGLKLGLQKTSNRNNLLILNSTLILILKPVFSTDFKLWNTCFN